MRWSYFVESVSTLVWVLHKNMSCFRMRTHLTRWFSNLRWPGNLLRSLLRQEIIKKCTLFEESAALSAVCGGQPPAFRFNLLDHSKCSLYLLIHVMKCALYRVGFFPRHDSMYVDVKTETTLRWCLYSSRKTPFIKERAAASSATCARIYVVDVPQPLYG